MSTTSTPSFGLSARKIKEVGRPYKDVFTESASAEFKVGTIYEPDDGSGVRYRYCKNGAVALGAAKLVQAPAPIGNHNQHIGGAGTVGALGAKTLTVGLTMTTALTANQYDEGWVHVNKVTGLGYAYRIKSHTNSVTPVLTLYEAIQVALDTTSEITLTSNPYNNVIITPATTITGQVVGIPRIAVTANYYFWLQVRGPAPVLVDTTETLVIGNKAGIPATAEEPGACGVATATLPVIGVVLSVNVAAEYALIDLSLN